MKTIVHVNQHKLRANRKNNSNDPVITIKTYKDNRYGHEAITSMDQAESYIVLIVHSLAELCSGSRLRTK